MHDTGTALVTGASSGIGLASAKMLLQAGYKVYGTSRSGQAKEKVEGVEYLQLDLTDSSSIAQLLAQLPPVDILINNAGASQMGAVEETPLSKMRELYELIFFGHIALIQGVLPAMRQKGKGLIINVTSLAELTPVPCSAVYASGKAAMHALSNGLRHELRPFGIDVVTLAPSFIQTPIIQERLQHSGSVYGGMIKNAGAVRDNNIRTGSDPIVVAQKILRIIHTKHPKSFYVSGRQAKLLTFMARCFPEKLREAIVRRHFKL